MKELNNIIAGANMNILSIGKAEIKYWKYPNFGLCIQNKL